MHPQFDSTEDQDHKTEEALAKIRRDNKKLTCKTCHKKFSRSDNLRTHQRIHTGEMPFPCRFCGQKFRWVSARSNHEDLHELKGIYGPINPSRVKKQDCEEEEGESNQALSNKSKYTKLKSTKLSESLSSIARKKKKKKVLHLDTSFNHATEAHSRLAPIIPLPSTGKSKGMDTHYENGPKMAQLIRELLTPTGLFPPGSKAGLNHENMMTNPSNLLFDHVHGNTYRNMPNNSTSNSTTTFEYTGHLGSRSCDAQALSLSKSESNLAHMNINNLTTTNLNRSNSHYTTTTATSNSSLRSPNLKFINYSSNQNSSSFNNQLTLSNHKLENNDTINPNICTNSFPQVSPRLLRGVSNATGGFPQFDDFNGTYLPHQQNHF